MFSTTKNIFSILVACDGFKDSLAATKVNRAIAEGFRLAWGSNDAASLQIQQVALSDGGQGFVESLREKLDLEIVPLRVTGPLGAPIDSSYGLNRKTGLAVLEVASAAGLEMVPPHQRNALLTTTRGLGELMRSAHREGSRKILVGLGGSATNDAGLGALQSLGLKIRCRNEEGEIFEYSQTSAHSFCGKDMKTIDGIEITPSLREFISSVHIEVACDVTNPFVGPQGAVSIFSPQKGVVLERDREVLEAGMHRVSFLISELLGVNIDNVAGAGAAGGIAGSFTAILKGTLRRGIEIMADSVQLTKLISCADLVVTGEGSFDSQTASGKTVSFVCSECERQGKKVVIVCGRKEQKQPSASGCQVFDLVSMFDVHKSMTETFDCLREMMSKKAPALLAASAKRNPS